ncbi:hypothetical protein [Variovorax saccharolyticus]|uniref:hypothetical protein n=1 Tax=Variovorax saccharolyticus TaxID=3053516 RepID=UPI002578D9CE|nr:hypothetical protein [Variovorax sp. J31P216]MDM0028120.1 hypothetical protein [Variovorax sp. J31P216]
MFVVKWSPPDLQQKEDPAMPSEPRDWPFDSPPDVACLTVRSIVEGVKPVLMASRDANDGAWQLLTGDAFDAAEEMRVSLASMIGHDPTLLQLADL